MAICGPPELVVYAQPVCDVTTGHPLFDELLLRVRTPGGAVVGPGELLAAAERDGRIAEIDCAVLGRAIAIIANGRAVSVNVSAQSVSDPAFLDTVERMLAGCSHPSRLTFEITETALMSDLIQASRFAERLRAFGCQFALDDFGTGYAPLTYLKHLPFRYLKIDMSFVRDIVENPRSRALVSGIVALAGSFGQQTIAEGVENADTLKLVRSLGVDRAQGFFLGSPAPA